MQHETLVQISWTTFRRVIFPLTIERRKIRNPSVFIPALIIIHDYTVNRREQSHDTRYSNRTAISRHAKLGNGFNNCRIPHFIHVIEHAINWAKRKGGA